MTTSDFDRNQLLRQALQPEAGCPPLADLLEATFAGVEGPRAEELRAHAAACAACAGELALAGALAWGAGLRLKHLGRRAGGRRLERHQCHHRMGRGCDCRHQRAARSQRDA